MADLQNFAIARSGNKALTVPTWSVSFQVTDERGRVLFDRTGAQAMSFPQILGQLAAEDQDEFVRMVMWWLISRRLNVG